jgi:DNA-binding MarR family transcriptional regulator
MPAPTTVAASACRPSLGRADLASRLELTFRLLGKRIYLPTLRHLRAVSPGLDRASVPLLSALEERGECRPSDIAAMVELDLSTVSRQLRQLEQLGLVSRRPDSDDRRAFRITLTPEGHDRLMSVRASRADMLDAVFSDWPDDERRSLQELLDRLLAGLAALPADPHSAPHSTSTSTPSTKESRS